MDAAVTATLAGPFIAEPNVYNIPEDAYHRDPVVGGSLSSSGARTLLKDCPAIFQYEQQHPKTSKAFDFGSAAHKEVLGTGPELVEIAGSGKNPEAWLTNADKEAVAEARLRGAIPLKPSEMAQVKAMAAKLREHPLAAALLVPEGGDPEQTLVWQDDETGIMCRAMLDWLPARRGQRLIIGDYKTAPTADPEAFRSSVHKWGYHQQDDWYLDGVRALGLDDDPDFVFVVQMKTPPYLVSLVRLDEEALRVGAQRNRQARRIYARCRETGIWPGYADDDITEVGLPAWAVRQHDNDFYDLGDLDD